MHDHPGSDAGDEAPPRIQGDEIRRRATRGVALLAARGIVIRILGFVGNVILALLLTPVDFGTVAIGTAVTIFVSLVADGGLGAALIRGDHQPNRLIFEQLLGFQLAIAIGVTAITVALAPLFATTGWVT